MVSRLSTCESTANAAKSLAESVSSQLSSRVYRTTFTGNGSTKVFSITHNLGAIPVIQVFNGSGQYFLADMTCTATTASFSFNTAPSSGVTYTVVAMI